MSDTIQRSAAIEIRIGNVGLDVKLDAIAAALQTVKEAHRDEISPRSWAAIGRAQDAIAEATLSRNEGRLLRPAAGSEAITLR